MIECSGNGLKMQQNRSEFQNFPRGAIPWTPSVGRLAHSAATVPIWPPGKHLPTLLGVGSVLVGQPRSIVILLVQRVCTIVFSI